MKKYLLAAAAMVMVSGAASAQSVNLVKNGGFESTSLTESHQFKDNQVTDWTNAATNGYTGYGYNFLLKPNTADTTGFKSLAGNLDYLYGPGAGAAAANFADNGFTGTSPAGGNFLLADGDTNFHGAVSQVISGLTVGQLYSVTFDWAGASWYTYAGNTTERWDVSLGGTTKSTDTVKLGPKGFSGWQKGSLQFTATGASQTLSFLAQGTPNGLPPSLLLDNVQMAAVPEPATWLTMILGFGVVGAAMRRRKVARPQLV
ncbi:PEPxxWA-CTERM sorting domain-containing protein [Sphingomonas endophytica]|uniref:PEP-CTERM protein-sorting domain-containing protein n=1 Tax=Sphingomonas endophytica TaxID=869719 RepID=A0A147HWU7_9SPHN|nr:PEPxxWA-CTERM sorting domain-containing protein [Sphingomonas endophytica]KTT69375.1 hypothetical protein NS334_14815 [Sphingomonas endophytica]